MAVDFDLQYKGEACEINDLGHRVLISTEKQKFSYAFASIKAKHVRCGEGVLQIGITKFTYEQSPGVEEEVQAFCSRFGNTQVVSDSVTPPGSSHEGTRLPAVKSAQSERSRGLAIARTVRRMTSLFIFLALAGCVAYGLLAYPRSAAIVSAIVLGIIVLFQGLLILMVAQYIIARLSEE